MGFTVNESLSEMFSPVCSYCKSITSIASKTCKAFPDGIPEDIWLGKNDHAASYPGDHGIRFERKTLEAVK